MKLVRKVNPNGHFTFTFKYSHVPFIIQNNQKTYGTKGIWREEVIYWNEKAGEISKFTERLEVARNYFIEVCISYIVKKCHPHNLCFKIL